jgi:hypothetical protein
VCERERERERTKSEKKDVGPLVTRARMWGLPLHDVKKETLMRLRSMGDATTER